MSQKDGSKTTTTIPVKNEKKCKNKRCNRKVTTDFGFCSHDCFEVYSADLIIEAIQTITMGPGWSK